MDAHRGNPKPNRPYKLFQSSLMIPPHCRLSVVEIGIGVSALDLSAFSKCKGELEHRLPHLNISYLSNPAIQRPVDAIIGY